MNKKLSSSFLILTFLIVFSSVQFLLILRHKSPYLSDSYFYKHIFYQFQGFSFQRSRELVLNQINFNKTDKIVQNIFLNQAVYLKTYGFFEKRPLYPFVAYLFNIIFQNEYLAFLIPVFISYLGVILLSFYFFHQELNKFFSVFAASLFISFYPFLDWSTYFLTDTIGTFFWLVQLLFVYKFLTTGKTKWFYFFLSSLIISFLNREQSILMLPLLVLSIVIAKFYVVERMKSLYQSAIITFLLVILYILTSLLTRQKNILDTIIYTMNSYGFYSNSYSFSQILNYLIEAVLKAHTTFIRELISHHWWFVFSIFAVFGVIKTFLVSKPSIVDILLICSALASYLAIYIYPVLSYRFFFPIVITVIYFAANFISDFFSQNIILTKQ